MNKIILFVIALCVNFSLHAEKVDLCNAANKASKILNKEVEANNSFTSEVRSRFGFTSDNCAFYVFNASDGKGFVIISAESEMPEIVAYSLSNSFDVNDMQPGLAFFLDTYSKIVDNVRNGEVYYDNISSAETTDIDSILPYVNHLCDCEWGQDKPYNNLCPKIDGKDCPVGCVATAMAQIMYHHRWPVQGKGFFSYATGISGWSPLSSNFSEHNYLWDEMCLTTKENQDSESAAKQMAQLLYDCGVSTRMKYGVDGSGTYDDLAILALYTYFGYRASTLRVEYRDSYSSQQEWNYLVKSELSSGRPVLYGAYTPNNSGHEFIIDGYNSKGLFHVNWGWDGKSNGYYDISILDVKNMGSFSVDQSMVCGIEPDFDRTDTIPAQVKIHLTSAPYVDTDTITLGELMSLHVGRYGNHSNTTHKWTVAVGLYNSEEEQVAVISKPLSKYVKEILSYYYLPDGIDVNCRIPAEIPDGSYTLRAVFCQDGYDYYVLPNMEGGHELNVVPFVVSDGKAYFNDAITSINNSKSTNVKIVKEEYYSIDGRRIEPSSSGIVIVRRYLSDGSSETIKRSL